MSRLTVTVIDVGWGDSILLDWQDGRRRHFGLIDSNDTVYQRSSYIFLKRFFEKERINTESKPLFDFVMLSHDHADHGEGLQSIMREFGTKMFWYPETNNVGLLANLIRYARRSPNVKHHEPLDDSKMLPSFGSATLDVLWPRDNQVDSEENNNSIVLSVTHGSVTIMLTGDAEGLVWKQIANQIPADTRAVKVPHHGSENGTFLGTVAPWLDRLDKCPPLAKLAISSHVRPFSHPDAKVIKEFETRKYVCFRTDEHYHLAFTSDGNDVKVKYSHE